LYSYEATDVDFNEEYGALTVAFGGLPDADAYPTVSLMLQRSRDEDEDEPGIEGVYAEWCAQGMSCYGCIRSFDLYPQSIRVTFNEDADFHVPEGVGGRQKLTDLVVTFKLRDEKLRELKEKLSLIFIGCDCYSVHEVDAATSA
jgi:hypothetical protein